MRRKTLLGGACVVLLAILAGVPASDAGENTDPPIRRGDANNSGAVTSADSSYIVNWLTNGGPVPPCVDAADANDDGTVDISDASYITNWLFLGGPAPPDPGPVDCGDDPTADALSCNDSICP